MIEKAFSFLKHYDGPTLKIMEVCGTHTQAIAKNGFHQTFSKQIQLISGPGCPVCVTPSSYIDKLVNFSKQEGHCVLSFGDMLKVPGQNGSLAKAKMEGGRVEFLYSPLQAIGIAQKNPDTQFVFAAVGFETTVAVYAVMVEEIVNRGINNLKLLTSIKTIIPALDFICKSEHHIDGFLCPGHVSVIIGSHVYEPLARRYQKPFVVTGFEGEHIIAAVYDIIMQIQNKEYSVKNLYKSSVSDEGNTKAWALIQTYFEAGDIVWRGIGDMASSGLFLKDAYAALDAGSKGLADDNIDPNCKCTDVILGRISPFGCGMFGKACTPSNPIGPCMVSSEGACGIYYTTI